MVLFIGRLEPRKGIDVFLEAAASLLAAGTNVTFVVAGDDRRPGPDGERYPDTWVRTVRLPTARLRVRRRGRRRRARFTDPRVARRRHAVALRVVRTCRGRGDDARSASRRLGRSVGIVELIEDGVTGRLVPPDDAARARRRHR